MASSRKRVLRVTGKVNFTLAPQGKEESPATERLKASKEKERHTSQGRKNLKTKRMFKNIK